MDTATAREAGILLVQIDALTVKMAAIDLAAEEKWPVTSMRVTAPEVGSTKPSGTSVDLVVGVAVSPDTSAMVLNETRKQYQIQFDALNAELAKL